MFKAPNSELLFVREPHTLEAQFPRIKYIGSQFPKRPLSGNPVNMEASPRPKGCLQLQEYYYWASRRLTQQNTPLALLDQLVGLGNARQHFS